MINIDRLLIEKFKSTCTDLKNHLNKYKDRVALREESHDTSFGVENLLEIIVSRLINEDNYGIVYSLTIKKQKKDDLKCIELSVIKGDGTFIETRDFWVKDELNDYERFMNDFKVYADHASKIIMDTLEGEYLT